MNGPLLWCMRIVSAALMLSALGLVHASPKVADGASIARIEIDEPYDAGGEYYFAHDVFLGSTNYRNYTRLEHSHFHRHAIEFGITLFTPDDITSSAPVTDDHPYANLLFMANSRIDVDPERGRIYQSSLMLGILGTPIGEQVQKQIHHLTDSEIPQGWDNQISDGGELTFKHSLSVHQMLLVHKGNLSYDLRGGLEAGLGYTTDLRASLSARWGKLSTPWWSFTPHQNEYINLGQTLSNKTKQGVNAPEFYLSGGVQVKYRLYNALLQGQLRESPVTFDHDELEPVILSAWLGVNKTFSSGLGLSLVIQAQSNEIDDPDLPNTVWGGLVVSKVY
ncbi:MAG: lipid A deacylase LpxR family protein [Candidatus Thiodiazotropha sp.]